MQRLTVIECVDKLSTNYDTFTSPELKEQRVKLLMDAFKHKLDSSLKSATEKVLHDENIKKFPTLMQLSNYMPVPYDKTQEFCDSCEKSGYYNIWQLRESIGQYYSFVFRCTCNTTTLQSVPLMDLRAIPTRAHNPFPPTDTRHKPYNLRRW